MRAGKGGETRSDGPSPTHEPPSGRRGSPPAGSAASSALRLMLVGGRAFSREALALAIDRRPGLSVVAQAGTLRAAGDALPEVCRSLDVIVVDPGLPDGEGGDLLRRMRAFGCDARALLLGHGPERDAIARAVAAGACGALDGAATLDELVDAVRRLGRGETLISPGELHELSRAAARRREEELAGRARLSRLTPRERELLGALTRGLSDRQISAELHITEGTVRQHVTRLLAKLEVPSRLRAALLGLRHGEGQGPG